MLLFTKLAPILITSENRGHHLINFRLEKHTFKVSFVFKIRLNKAIKVSWACTSSAKVDFIGLKYMKVKFFFDLNFQNLSNNHDCSIIHREVFYTREAFLEDFQ